MLVYKNKLISFNQLKAMSRLEFLQSPLTNIFCDQASASKEKNRWVNRWVTTLKLWHAISDQIGYNFGDKLLK